MKQDKSEDIHKNKHYEFQSVATYYGPLKEKFGLPRQAGLVKDLTGKIVFHKEFSQMDAFRGMEDFSHLWLVWVFTEHVGTKAKSTVRPPRLKGNVRRGVWASRSPFRPNPIGMSVVQLLSYEVTQEGPTLHISGADLLDGTDILDIKPYIPYADSIGDARADFASEAPERKEVLFECEKNILEDTDIAVVTELLAQDPRPAYQEEPTRTYGMRYKDWNVKFRVENQHIHVISIESFTNEDEKLSENTKAKAEKKYWVYILRCNDNTLYTGIAVDIEKRLLAHNTGKGAKYTKNRGPCEILYRECLPNRSEASKREAAIKKLSREEKLALIKAQ